MTFQPPGLVIVPLEEDACVSRCVTAGKNEPGSARASPGSRRAHDAFLRFHLSPRGPMPSRSCVQCAGQNNFRMSPTASWRGRANARPTINSPRNNQILKVENREARESRLSSMQNQAWGEGRMENETGGDQTSSSGTDSSGESRQCPGLVSVQENDDSAESASDQEHHSDDSEQGQEQDSPQDSLQGSAAEGEGEHFYFPVQEMPADGEECPTPKLTITQTAPCPPPLATPLGIGPSPPPLSSPEGVEKEEDKGEAWTLLSLPDAVIAKILGEGRRGLRGRDLASLGCTCRRFSKAKFGRNTDMVAMQLVNDWLWSERCLELEDEDGLVQSELGVDISPHPNESWKRLLSFLEKQKEVERRRKRIAMGDAFGAMATTGGQLLQWGQTATTTTTESQMSSKDPPQLTPVIFSSPDTAINIVQVACGEAFTLVLSDDGRVFSWGSNQHGQLGRQLRPQEDSCESPTALDGLLDDWIVQVVAGGRHAVAVSTTGCVFTWGSGSFGQLGHGPQPDPTPFPRRLGSECLRRERVLMAAAGSVHTALLLGDGSVLTFGGNDNGQLGSPPDYETHHWPSPVSGLGGPSGECVHELCMLSYSSMCTAVLLADGSLLSWGTNYAFPTKGAGPARATHSQTSARTVWQEQATEEEGEWIWTASDLPIAGAMKGRFTCSQNKIADVAVGALHMVAVDDAGSVYAGGWNHFGQLGKKKIDLQPLLVPLDTSSPQNRLYPPTSLPPSPPPISLDSPHKSFPLSPPPPLLCPPPHIAKSKTWTTTTPLDSTDDLPLLSQSFDVSSQTCMECSSCLTTCSSCCSPCSSSCSWHNGTPSPYSSCFLTQSGAWSPSAPEEESPSQCLCCTGKCSYRSSGSVSSNSSLSRTLNLLHRTVSLPALTREECLSGGEGSGAEYLLTWPMYQENRQSSVNKRGANRYTCLRDRHKAEEDQSRQQQLPPLRIVVPSPPHESVKRKGSNISPRRAMWLLRYGEMDRRGGELPATGRVESGESVVWGQAGEGENWDRRTYSRPEFDPQAESRFGSLRSSSVASKTWSAAEGQSLEIRSEECSQTEFQGGEHLPLGKLPEKRIDECWNCAPTEVAHPPCVQAAAGLATTLVLLSDDSLLTWGSTQPPR